MCSARASYYLGIDVGTSSARVALVDASGRICARAASDFPTRHAHARHYEQSSELILAAVQRAARECVCAACEKQPNESSSSSSRDVPDGEIIGIGIDATCSLVVLSHEHVGYYGARESAAAATAAERKQHSARISVCDPRGERDDGERDADEDGDGDETARAAWNVIVWMCHRAEREADAINAEPANRHIVARYGGRMSLENEPPKLAWLAAHTDALEPARCGAVMDLADFLVFACTGDAEARGLCAATAKWAYRSGDYGDGDGDGERGGCWEDDFFRRLGVGHLLDDNYRRLGRRVVPPGAPVGAGLSDAAAERLFGRDMVRNARIRPRRHAAVASGMVDAHAGGVGMLGAALPPACGSGGGALPLEQRLALICGTSTCHMASSRAGPIRVDGVWGPFRSAMMPGVWLNEGGQSVTGRLLDYLLETHPASPWRSADERHARLAHAHRHVCARIAADPQRYRRAAAAVHVYPDWHGNRAPLSDPCMTGGLIGLGLDAHTPDGLATLYLATVQALAYGTRQIIDAMNDAGHELRIIMMCGGMTRNDVFVRTLADACNMPVVLADEEDADPMLVGAAACARAAAASSNQVGVGVSGDASDRDVDIDDERDGSNARRSALEQAMQRMNRPARACITPRAADCGTRAYHDAKYAVFLRMQRDQMAYREMMRGASA